MERKTSAYLLLNRYFRTSGLNINRAKEASLKLWKNSALPIGVITVPILLVLALWKIPQIQVGYASLPLDKRIELEDKARATLAQSIGGAVLLIGLYFNWRNLKNTEASAAHTLKYTQETLRLSLEAQVTERFTRAVDQLGNEKLEIKLGGIYALGRIANDSAKDYWQIIEILTTYVREKAPWSKPLDRNEQPPGEMPGAVDLSKHRMPSDIQAILMVVNDCRQSHPNEEEVHYIDLSRVDLRRLNLPSEAKLYGIDFQFSNLEGATLPYACLSGANLSGAKLNYSKLPGADLSRACLMDAHLRQTSLRNANLTRACLVDAYMKYADFEGANLEDVDLRCAYAEHASFRRANLKGANLYYIHLEGSYLDVSSLQNASLLEAHLQSATFCEANLEGTDFTKADLEGTLFWKANLTGAIFEGANLSKANFSHALGLTKEQLSKAASVEDIKLPQYLSSIKSK